jgi:alpha 1,3-glucosidase
MYQLGIFFPFMRAHGIELDSHKREPWLFDLETQQVIKDCIFLRYSLIHYLYTAFYQATKTGIPIMRPLYLEFPKDPRTFSLQT